jgi:ABC-2 type transport system ATP-binding protein
MLGEAVATRATVTRRGRREYDHHPTPTGDRGDRPAQVVWRHARAGGVDLDVAEGTIFALLGPNGAGKTTAVQILSSLISPDAGEVRVAGHDLAREPDAVRSAIGVTGQFSAVDNLLTGEENLLLMADLYHLDRREGRQRTADLLERFELVEAAKKTPAIYSGGMRRRLDLAMTLVGDPRIIFLDEPTAGLDPRSRRTTWEIVRGLVAGGATIFLTTQYLEEADELADRIALLDQGKLVAEGTADELKRRIPGGHVRLHSPTPTGSIRPPAPSGRWCATTRRLACRSPATAAWNHCELSSTGSTTHVSRSTASQSTRPTSTTSSWPSPASPKRRKPDERWFLCVARFGDDAAAQSPARAALPDADPDESADPGADPVAVRRGLR